jgi:hypothetical protein
MNTGSLDVNSFHYVELNLEIKQSKDHEILTSEADNACHLRKRSAVMSGKKWQFKKFTSFLILKPSGMKADNTSSNLTFIQLNVSI